MKQKTFLSLFLVLVSSLPAMTRLFSYYLFGKEINSFNVYLSLSSSSFALCMLTMGLYLKEQKRIRSGLHVWFQGINMIVIVGVIQLTVFIDLTSISALNLNNIYKAIGSVYILSIANFLTIFHIVGDASSEPEVESPIDNNAYVASLKWLAPPLFISTMITFITWWLSDYQSNIINHATIFGVYLAIFVVLRDKFIEFKNNNNTTRR